MSNVDDLFEIIRRRKLASSMLAREYINYPQSIVSYAREIWKGLVTYRYEDIDIDYRESAKKLLLANLMLERYLLKSKRNLLKHLAIAICGLAGSGKTTYSVLSIYGMMARLGYSEEEIYSYLSKVVLFEPIDYVSLPKYLLENKLWVPAVVFDDVGSQVSKYWHFMGETFWVYLFSVLDQLKDWVGVLVITARSFTSIPARFREIVDIVVSAKEIEINGVVLDVFEYYYNTGKNPFSKHNLAFVDVMLPVARMPDNVWNKMMEQRRETGLKRMNIIYKVVVNLPKIEEAKASKLIENINKMLEKDTNKK